MDAIQRISRNVLPKGESAYAWVPGRVIGGVALIVGPLVWFAGLLVRHIGVQVADFTPDQQALFDKQMLTAPEQLTAYAQHPQLVMAGYTLFALGSVLLFPAVIAFARIVAARSPRLAMWGGTLFVSSLFARWYYAGIEQTAFQMVDRLGREKATNFVMDSYTDLSYGLWRIPVTASMGSIVGMVLLVVGAYLAGKIGLGRGVLLLLFGWVFMGVLKESSLILGVLAGGLSVCLVFIPLGVAALRDRIPEVRSTPTPLPDSSQARLPLRIW
ncbi:hypothetical protein [Streptomyces oceani]|uniref:Uncharacterized protein n=1 Tax=Streptomyces oceani TaxID=1075402 RepID=A0A1E7JX46_9ACTN|nr:hypothetical protein [Streptomyces oceani]OEU96250.1 hypothetical protein AN216_21385 [Streptomyces oceani]